MKVKVEKIANKDKIVLSNLFQLYMHYITKYLHMEVNEHGLFTYDYIDYYWKNENYEPYFIKVDNQIAGFILVDDEFMELKDKKAKDLSEFFVLNWYRRKGVGKKAAFQVFDMHKGKWEVRPVPKSPEAFAFWNSIIDEYTHGQYKVKDVPEDNRQIITFDSSKL